MKCKIEKSKLSGQIICPANKSYTHRAIFLSALSDGKSIIKKMLNSNDTNATISACRAFGVEVDESDDTLTIENSIGSTIQGSMINAQNSGTTIRIATAIAALSGGTTELTGDNSLKKRPMKPLLDSLEELGITTESDSGKPPIIIKGKIHGNKVNIKGDISSQFISALLIIAPRLENGLTIEIDGNVVSKPYIDLTITTMKKFGADVKTIEPYKKYSITHQIYKPTTFTIPSDFSNLALLLSANILLGDNLKIKINLGELPQGDEEIVDILEKLGVNVTLDGETITTKSPDLLDGGKFDLSNTPDLLPALAILVLKCKNQIEIHNVKHARYKETDRIAIICNELKKVGIIVSENDDGMTLKKGDIRSGVELDSHGDHRLFMAFSILAMSIGDCVVTDPDSASVSYPNFVSDMQNCGGRMSIV